MKFIFRRKTERIRKLILFVPFHDMKILLPCRHLFFYFFFDGHYLSKILNMKDFKIKTRKIKFFMEEEIPSGTKSGVGWSSTPPTL